MSLGPAAHALPVGQSSTVAQGGPVIRPAGQLETTPAIAPSGTLLSVPAIRHSATPGSTSSSEGSGVAVASPSPLRKLLLLRSQRQLVVLENDREVRRFPVAVGMPGWETPVGQFTVIEKTPDPVWQHPATGKLIPPGQDNPLGSRWIGFYRDCRGRSGFNGQEHLEVKGCVTTGFHGTPNRSSVGREVSHGCVRLFEEHVRDLFDLVTLGTVVTVVP